MSKAAVAAPALLDLLRVMKSDPEAVVRALGMLKGLLKRYPFADIATFLPGYAATLRSTKWIDDAETVVEHDPVLHIFGPERVAIGVQRRGGDHRIPGR
jgi:hypothetical protein